MNNNISHGRSENQGTGLPGLLPASCFGRPHFEHHPTIDSTNLRAMELAASGAEEGTLVTADTQTRGRGRLGRDWHSPPGRNLYFSIVLRPGIELEQYPLVTLAAGLGASEGIASATGLRPSIKWPNDLLLQGGKLAGLLCETGPITGRDTYAVLGVGINVNLGADELTPDISARAVSLSIAAGRTFDPTGLLPEVLAGLEKRYLQLKSGRRSELLRDYRRACSTLVQRLRSAGKKAWLTAQPWPSTISAVWWWKPGTASGCRSAPGK